MPGDVVHQATLGTLTLRQVLSSSYSSSAQPVIGTASGGLDPAQIYGGQTQQTAELESEDVGSAMAISNFLTAGLAVSSGTISIPWQKRAQGSTFASGSAHETVSAANGLIVPTSISVQQGGNATISLMVYVRSTDGFTDPVTVNADQSISSETFQGLFGLGPGSVNGNTLTELQGVTINPGITVEPQLANGGQYPTLLHITTRRPTMDFTFRDFADLQANFNASFTTGTAAVAYLRARSGTGFAATTAESHIKFSFTDGMVTTEAMAAQGTDTGSATLRVYGESLAVATSSAIT